MARLTWTMSSEESAISSWVLMPRQERLGPLTLADRVITDREPSQEWKARFEERGIALTYKSDTKI